MSWSKFECICHKTNDANNKLVEMIVYSHDQITCSKINLQEQLQHGLVVYCAARLLNWYFQCHSEMQDTWILEWERMKRDKEGSKY